MGGGGEQGRESVMATRITIPGTSPQQIGRAAQRRGGNAERAIEGMNRIYQTEKRAIIDRQNVATRGGPRARMICGRAPVDFAGVLAGGRAVAVELKTTGKAKTSLAIGDRGIRAEQVDALTIRGQMGALSGLLWLNGDRLGWADWTVVLEHAAERASIPASAFVWLEPLAFDWLGVALNQPAAPCGASPSAGRVAHRDSLSSLVKHSPAGGTTERGGA